MSAIISAEGWMDDSASVTIFVARKDDTSNYVDLFPEYEIEEIPVLRSDVHASDNRIAWLTGKLNERDDTQVLPSARAMYDRLASCWPEYSRLQEDLAVREQWSALGHQGPRREVIMVAHTQECVLVVESVQPPYRGKLSLPIFTPTVRDLQKQLRRPVQSLDSSWQRLKAMGRIRTVSKSAYGVREACVEERNYRVANDLSDAFDEVVMRKNRGTCSASSHCRYMGLKEVWKRRSEFIEDHPFIIEDVLGPYLLPWSL
jgi:hypothetical protein